MLLSVLLTYSNESTYISDSNYVLQFPEKIYTVNVKTGDKSGCGTNANVFLTVLGDRGDTGERKLARSETNFDKFEKNQVHTEYLLTIIVTLASLLSASPESIFICFPMNVDILESPYMWLVCVKSLWNKQVPKFLKDYIDSC